MKRECLNCGQKEMVYTVRDVPHTYKKHPTVISDEITPGSDILRDLEKQKRGIAAKIL